MANLVRLVSLRRTSIFPRNIRVLPQSFNATRNCSQDSFPTQSQVVICGGGTIGTSVAYHLTLKGVTDVVLLEQGSLSCGTSWHGAGLFGRNKSGPRGIMADYGTKLLKDLDDKEYHAGLVKNGSITLCGSKDRKKAIMYDAEKTRANGIESYWISQERIPEFHPFVNAEKFEGGMYVPDDCVANPTDICQTFAKLAKEKGAKVIEDCQINSAETKDGRISSVTTSKGKISCEYFILCGGMWSHHFGLKMNPQVVIPAHASEHFYIITKPIKGTHAKLPTLRDYDRYTYIREWSGGLLCGIFEPNALPAFADGPPSDLRYHLFESNWEHFEPWISNITDIVPCVENAEIQQLLNGPESFSTDLNMVLGETSNVRNMYVATGMGSNGIVQSSGVGRIISELICNEEPFVDYSPFDIKRFEKHVNTPQYLFDRTTEIVNSNYRLNFPMQTTYSTSRGARTSSLYPLQQQSGAVFKEINHVETPAYFNKSNKELPTASMTKPNWFDLVKEEYHGCVDHCGIVDMAHHYSYYKISSPQARDVLGRICKEEIPSEPGQVVHTWLLDSNAKYILDIDILCQSENSFMLVVPFPKQNIFSHWLRKSQESSQDKVEAENMTFSYTTVALVGEKAKSLFGDVSKSAINEKQYKTVQIGYGDDILAFKPGYFTKHGVLLSIPTPYIYSVYDALKKHAMQPKDIGFWAYETIRVMEGIPALQHELGPTTKPLQIFGQGSEAKTQNFIGKQALTESGQTKVKLAQVQIKEVDSNYGDWFWGGEIIKNHEKQIGKVTSIMYDFAENKFAGMAFVDFNEKLTNAYITYAEKEFPINIKEL